MSKDRLVSFQDKFDEIVHEAQRFSPFVRAKELQQEQIIKLDRLLEQIIEYKKEMVEESNEEYANILLSLQSMAQALTSELKMIIELKNDNPNDGWNHLIDAQMNIRTAMQAHPTGGEHLEGYVQKLHALEKLLFPNQMFMSTGLVAKEGECSICGQEYGECDHLKGKPYMGEICCEIVKKADLQEVSIVTEPADKRCRAYTFQEGDINRDIMTWRELKDQK